MEKTAIVFSLNFNFHVFLIFLYVFITFFTAKSHIFSRFYIKYASDIKSEAHLF